MEFVLSRARQQAVAAQHNSGRSCSARIVWEFPIFKNRKDVLAKILEGWQLSGITSFQTGLPINVTQGGDVANFGGGTAASALHLTTPFTAPVSTISI